MFGRHKSPVRKRLKKLLAVSDTWIEWTLEDGAWVETVVVAFEYDTDPVGKSFRREFLDDVQRVFSEDATDPPRRLKVVPRGLSGASD